MTIDADILKGDSMGFIVGVVATFVGVIVAMLKVLAGILFLSAMGIPILIIVACFLIYGIAGLVRRGGK